ncbi:CGLAU_01105 family protein [Corynebacterium breve]|uniref:CGLAU_01105 family protein n=1 Tax=Corynebacterium breve TaxID=3049799 RepID=A0ABY8VFW1_9CORY|nr:CGLAU_01105 family protein [Corynebacterium breve]WIM67987.1 CGLAU_01105 family protein [Corynebacterium breve]
MTDNMNNQAENQAENNNNDSVLDSLKDAGEAFLVAGGRLGDVVGDFTKRFKEERTAEQPVGAHMMADEVDANDTLVQQMKAAVSRARDSFKEASSKDEYKNASVAFAGDAEGIVRDLAGSVNRAARGTKDTAQADEARTALNDAVSQVREGFDKAVSQVRDRAASSNNAEAKTESEGFINDARGFLDNMINRISDALNRDDADDIKDAANSNAEQAHAEKPAEVIDGEVVNIDDDSDTSKGDSI